MNKGFRIFLVLLAAVLALARADARAQDGPAARDDVPNIRQLLALPGGRVLVVTTEKGGLYLSDSGGGGWRKAEGAPEVFVNRATLAPGGRVYLATSEGLYVFRKGAWNKAVEGALADIFFNGDGSSAMLRYWGRGLHFLSAEGMSAESLQDMRDAAGREAALSAEEAELQREMKRLQRGNEATEEEKFALRDVYAQWLELQRRKEQAHGEARAAMPERVMGGLPEGVSVVGAIPWEGGWLTGVFGHGVLGLAEGERQWSPRQDGLPGPWVLCLELSPSGQAFAGFFGAGLFSLEPGSSSWTRVDGVPADCSVQAVSFGAKGRILAATRERGALYSPDFGKTWAEGPGGNVQGVAVGTDGSLWAGLWEEGLRVSFDDGATWKPRPFAYVGHVADMVFSEDGRGFAVLVGLGLLTSTDNGASWSHAELPVHPSRTVRLALGRDGRLFAASPREGLFVSADNGATWSRDKRGLPDGGVRAVGVTSGGTPLAVPADGSGLFALDGATGWSLVPLVGEEDFAYSAWNLTFLPGNRAMAVGYQDILLSEDDGRTWRRHRFGQAVEECGVDVSGTIFTRHMLSNFALRPGGDDWDSVQGIPLGAYRLLRFAGSERWLGARRDGGLDILEARGVEMVIVASHAPGSTVTSLAGVAGGALFAGLEDGMIVSRDGGRTWSRCELVDY